MMQFLSRRWFLLGLVLMLSLGFGFPAQLATAAAWIPRKTIIAAVLFLMALPLEGRMIRRALMDPRAVMLAIAINYGLLPLAAWQLTTLMRGDLAVGLMIVASVPCTMASAAVWTRRAGGNDAVALMVTMIMNLACFVVTPLWLSATTRTEVEIELSPMIQRLALIMVLPMVLGQAVRVRSSVRTWAARHRTPLGVAAQCGILSMVFVGAVSAGGGLSGGSVDINTADWLKMIFAVVALHTGMLATGYYLAGAMAIGRAERIAVAFAGSQKTLMIGLGIALEYFSELPLASLPMVAYHVFQLFIDTLIADRWGRQKSDAQW